MAILDISVNDDTIVRVGDNEHCSLAWDIIDSVTEEHAMLTVSGLVHRGDGNYDSSYWLDSYPLAPGARVVIQQSKALAGSPAAKTVTHEQHESLRREVQRAEAAGEYDAARQTPRPRLRPCVKLTIRAGADLSVASDDNVATVTCSGLWSNHHRSEELRIRVKGVGSADQSRSFWHPLASGVVVDIAA